MKYDHFERQWQKQWMDDVKNKMTTMFNEYRDDNDEFDAMPLRLNSNDKSEKTFDINCWRFGPVKKLDDELTQYLKALLLVLEGQKANNEFDALAWWKGNAMQFPTLVRIAFEIYSIPAMSVEPERVFSGYGPMNSDNSNIGCKLSITDLRNRLLTELVEAIECLHSWFK